MEDKCKELIKELENNPANDYSIQETKELTNKILNVTGFKYKCPVPIVRIIHAFDIAGIKAINVPNDMYGSIFIGGNTKEYYNNDKVIVVEKSETLQHQRLIIAHELAHYFLDYLGNTEYMDKDKAYSKMYYKNNNKNDIKDIRADIFAIELLMPIKTFTFEYVKAMKKSNYNKIYTIAYLSKLFEVPEGCVIKRINDILN